MIVYKEINSRFVVPSSENETIDCSIQDNAWFFSIYLPNLWISDRHGFGYFVCATNISFTSKI